MTLSSIIIIAKCVILQILLLVAVFFLGKHIGYWERVRNEKSAKGIV